MDNQPDNVHQQSHRRQTRPQPQQQQQHQHQQQEQKPLKKRRRSRRLDDHKTSETEECHPEKLSASPSSSSIVVDDGTNSLEKCDSSNKNAKKVEHQEEEEEEEKEEEEILLTPHTLRLLKLIEQGSTDHARMAANQLESITANHNGSTGSDSSSSSSPTVLWEILGRLQYFLCSIHWQTRQNASIAMEGVASHIPILDQRQFLKQNRKQKQVKTEDNQQHDKNDISVETSDGDKYDDLWLTTNVLQGTMLKSIIVNGRQLLASSEQRYEIIKEDEMIYKLDRKNLVKGTQSDYCEERLRLQRKILAHRLGLSGILFVDGVDKCGSSGIGNNTMEDIDNAITAQDFNTDPEKDDNESQKNKKNSDVSSIHQKKNKKRSRGKKRKRRKYDDDDKEDDGDDPNIPKPIRAILVMEIKQQERKRQQQEQEGAAADPRYHHHHNHQQQQHGEKQNSLSHYHPQNLLAGELVYRLFDSSWHVRHGSLMGILGLLRAWKVQEQQQVPDTVYDEYKDEVDDSTFMCTHPSTSSSSCTSIFGTWPHDILSRCICVLALERFADYSGTTVDASCGGIISPVREMAGQVVSLLYFAAPTIIQQQTYRVIESLSLDYDDDDWEIRHGALLALKYIITLYNKKSKGDENNNGNNPLRQKQELQHQSTSCGYLPLDRIANLACRSLDDKSDDVRSVAAQILRVVRQVSKTDKRDDAIIDGSLVPLEPVWKSLKRSRIDSPAIKDLITLFSEMVCQNNESTKQIELSQKVVKEARINPKTTIADSDVSGVVLRDVFERLEMLLTQPHNSITGTILYAIGSMVDHGLSGLFVSPPSDSLSPSPSPSLSNNELRTLGQRRAEDVRIETMKAFTSLVLSVFEIYFDSCIILQDYDDMKSKAKEKQACSRTWEILITKGCRQFFQSGIQRDNDEMLLSIGVYLLSKYYGMDFGKQLQRIEHTKQMLSLPFFDMRRPSSGSRLSAKLDIADAIALFFVTTVNTNRDLLLSKIIHLCINAGLESPLPGHCESCCLLLHSIIVSMSKKNGGNASRADFDTAAPDESSYSSHLQDVLDTCLKSIPRMVQTAPNCILVDNPKLFVSPTPQFEVVFPNSMTNGVGILLQKRESDVMIAAKSVLEDWQGSVEWTDVNPSLTNTMTPKALITVHSMRISVLLSGVVIAGGYNFLPSKLTPIIQSLMTSIMNERDEVCQNLSSRYLLALLHLLLTDDPAVSAERKRSFLKTKTKILDNLCSLMMPTQQQKQQQQEPQAGPAFASASHIIGMLLNGTTVQAMEHVWARVRPLAAKDDDDDDDDDDNPTDEFDEEKVSASLVVLKAVCQHLQNGTEISRYVVKTFLPSLVKLSVEGSKAITRETSMELVKAITTIEDSLSLPISLPIVAIFLQQKEFDLIRVRGNQVLLGIMDTAKMSIRAYVRSLLPLAMSLMTDPNRDCAKAAAAVFSRLVQLAPLIRHSIQLPITRDNQLKKADLVMDHLLVGKKLPFCKIHDEVVDALAVNGISLRDYQHEGISWLRFLQAVNLNGSLCDAMGLGKTLQALVATALAHIDCQRDDYQPSSLVVCPASVTGHWLKEVGRYFPDQRIFRASGLSGGIRKQTINSFGISGEYNLFVISYDALRRNIDTLSQVDWHHCILDEGHLLKNPKTATAKASRRLKSKHRLILTGTPVQNNVQEVWAAFDFLMPNFLGSSSDFRTEFAKPITKSQRQGALATDIANGIEKLKMLHQQVLPFILRREKEQVLRELPPVTTTIIPCEMSAVQSRLYQEFCHGTQAKKALDTLRNLLEDVAKSEDGTIATPGSDVLRSLLYLRLLCTHPSLVISKRDPTVVHSPIIEKLDTVDCSGKLIALKEVLVQAGIHSEEYSAADDDTTLLYCKGDDDEMNELDDVDAVLHGVDDDDDDGDDGYGAKTKKTTTKQLLSTVKQQPDTGSRCLIFAQFSQSLNIVEELLLKRHMPSVRYLRLDGKVPTHERSSMVDTFNTNTEIKVMLLTTRIGGLGLNLTGADVVIFLEHDWNPHADLQAMDRAHRLGQTKKVHVYKLVTAHSIEEKIMTLHEKKIAMSKAIVNTKNSSIFSMGTDRLLDIFQFRSDVSKGGTSSPSSSSKALVADHEVTLDSLVERYEEEYQSLTMKTFLMGFKNNDGRTPK